ncbi:GntR family transcriptional regulator [Sanguibacter suaedae]|uniref:GntR family transcriptional regulator n=1 Tax=Sanguibacter suaedae TaxID=2795737 RepID=A0A934M8E1_9MICO|nr:GntR family transcriptional regulator [Sanguibacter suaedae]MBI9113473.1 GntR family transcriptional regulator [Sanguibacter suaedae]
MRIAVDLDSSTPHYEQIRAQIGALITAGALSEGDRLPTVRTLAADLGIAGGTVARAYRELEAAGLVSTRRRLGTVVTAPTRPAGRSHEVARQLVATARSEGISDAEVLDLVRSALLAPDPAIPG